MEPNAQDLIQAKKIASRKFLLPNLRRGVATLNREAEALDGESAGRNVHAVGIGLKVTKGSTTDQSIAIRVYVIKKVDLPDDDPRAIPKFFGEIPTDVIESPPAFLFPEPASGPTAAALSALPSASVDCSSRSQLFQSTLIGGISTGRENGPLGTIGCFCRSTRTEEHGFRLILSNQHVYGSTPGGKLVQPASDNPNSRPIATLLRASKPDRPGVVGHRSDAAVGKLMSVPFDQRVCSVGKVQARGVATRQMTVTKHGCVTRQTTGVVDDDHHDLLVGVTPGGPPDETFLATEQFRIRGTNGVFARGGDSGSLVMAGNRTAVGLLFAAPKNGSYGVANQISVVFEDLEIELA